MKSDADLQGDFYQKKAGDESPFVDRESGCRISDYRLKEGGKVNAERIGAIFWLGIGLSTIFGSFQVKVGTLKEPGSGFLPFLTGCFICLLALLVFFRSFRGRGGIQAKLSALWEGVEWRRPIVIGVIMIAYILALEKGGFLITSFLLLLVILKGTEKYSWKKAFLISALASTFTFLLLGVALKATLPRGIFGF